MSRALSWIVCTSTRRRRSNSSRHTPCATDARVQDAYAALEIGETMKRFRQLAGEILRTVPGVVSATYNIASKPPSTIEAV